MVRARAYIRLSRWREGDEKLSPEVQLEAARAICAARGWVLDEEASLANQDLDVSGYYVPWRDCPGMVKHFEDAKRGGFDRLLIAAIDRLGRSTADRINCWDEFEKRGVAFYSIREGVDTSTDAGFMMRNILLTMAEMESRNASSRIRANVEARARRGRLHGGKLPSWLTRDEEGALVVVERVASSVLRAVELRLSGHSYTSITRTLNAEGRRTASGSRFQKSYIVKLFKRDWVDSMFGVAYTRRQGRGKPNPNKDIRERVSRGKPIAIEGGYPAIIDAETYARLLKIATEPDDSETPVRNHSSERWMLNGVLRCAVCGSRMGVHCRKREDGSVRRTYFCEAHNDDPGAVEHPVSRVDADMLESSVLELLSPALSLMTERPKPKEKPLLREEAEVNRELLRVLSQYAKGKIPEHILDQQVDSLNEELAAIVRAKGAVETEPEKPNLASRVSVRKWLRDNRVQVSYPHYLEGAAYKENWRTGKAAPIPHVSMGVAAGSLLSPVLRKNSGRRSYVRQVGERFEAAVPAGEW